MKIEIDVRKKDSGEWIYIVERSDNGLILGMISLLYGSAEYKMLMNELLSMTDTHLADSELSDEENNDQDY